MRAHWVHPFRLVRVLLACAVLWLGTGSSGRADVWKEAVVAIAEIQATDAGSSDVESRRSRPRASVFRFPLVSRNVNTHAPTRPPNTERAHHPVQDIYLRNNVLLC